MDYKKYLYSLKFFILFAFLFFIFSIGYGYFAAKNFPQEAETILEKMQKVFEPILETSPLQQVFLVILNNTFTLISVILLGIAFGIFPLLVLFLNGNILGIVAFFYGQILDRSKFFVGVMPHGIIEIPIFIISCAIGLKIGKTTYQKIFKKQGELKKEFSFALKFFLKILLPFLIIAAAIEIFITSRLLGI